MVHTARGIDVIFRPIQESDHNMIRASFVETARHSASANGCSGSYLSELAFNAATKFIGTVLCDEDVPDEIIGWAIWKDSRNVFWVAVKPRYQNMGFGKTLLDSIGVKPGVIHVPLIVGHAAAWAGRMGIRLSPRPYMGL